MTAPMAALGDELISRFVQQDILFRTKKRRESTRANILQPRPPSPTNEMMIVVLDWKESGVPPGPDTRNTAVGGQGQTNCEKEGS